MPLCRKKKGLFSESCSVSFTSLHLNQQILMGWHLERLCLVRVSHSVSLLSGEWLGKNHNLWHTCHHDTVSVFLLRCLIFPSAPSTMCLQEPRAETSHHLQWDSLIGVSSGTSGRNLPLAANAVMPFIDFSAGLQQPARRQFSESCRNQDYFAGFNGSTVMWSPAEDRPLFPVMPNPSKEILAFTSTVDSLAVFFRISEFS